VEGRLGRGMLYFFEKTSQEVRGTHNRCRLHRKGGVLLVIGRRSCFACVPKKDKFLRTEERSFPAQEKKVCVEKERTPKGEERRVVLTHTKNLNQRGGVVRKTWTERGRSYTQGLKTADCFREKRGGKEPWWKKKG